MKKIFIAIIALLAVFTAQAQKKGEGVYVMGASLSFTDSIVYFTEIQYLEDVALEKGSGFLPERQHYSLELQEYMAANEQMSGRTSIILFAKKKSKLKRREEYLKQRLEKRRSLKVRYLGEKFQFTKP